ncbi:unnamed protein product [Leuciscus chuanchicus]
MVTLSAVHWEAEQQNGRQTKARSTDHIEEKVATFSGDFRLQYLDTDFDDFLNLTSTLDLQDKGTVKVVAQSAYDVCSLSSADTDIRSSTSADTDIRSSTSSPSPSCLSVSQTTSDVASASTSELSSSTTLRSETWPTNFPIPKFPYEVELELQKAHEEFLNDGTLLNIDLKPKLKSEILKSLAAEVVKYKVYPRIEEYEEVAKALITKHPYLQEKGSVGGFYGWKISLQWKMANYRRTLRAAGCSEVKINSLKHKHGENTSPNQVKKPKKAEVNFYPDYPAGENKQSLEEERLALLSEIAAEFTRITTVPLIQTFMSKLDGYTSKLASIYRRKGGTAGRQIWKLMATIDENDTISTRRACILRALSVYLNEDYENLMKEYADTDFENSERDMANTVIGIYIIRPEDAEACDPPSDVGLIVEGVTVLQNIGDVTKACALLLGVIYCLNLSYPSDLKYTFEFFQKVLLGLDAQKLSHKIQVLKNKLVG